MSIDTSAKTYEYHQIVSFVNFGSSLKEIETLTNKSEDFICTVLELAKNFGDITKAQLDEIKLSKFFCRPDNRSAKCKTCFLNPKI